MTVTSLTLQPITGQTRTTASLTTDSPVTAAIPTTCPLIIAAQQTNSTDLLRNCLLPTSGQTAATSLLKNLTDFKSALTGSTVDTTQKVDISGNGYTAIDTYLTTTTTSVVPLLQHVANCISEANIVSPDALKEQKELTQQSLDRLDSIQSPENKSSPYQSWFPLPRPMVQPALFGLFGTALLLLLASTAIFLRLGGVEIQVIMPMIDFYGISEFFKSKSTILGAGIITGALISAIGFWRGWFS